jgi:hypothetical protein
MQIPNNKHDFML